MLQAVCDSCERQIESEKLKRIQIVTGAYITETKLCGVCHGKLITKVERFINGEEAE